MTYNRLLIPLAGIAATLTLGPFLFSLLIPSDNKKSFSGIRPGCNMMGDPSSCGTTMSVSAAKEMMAKMSTPDISPFGTALFSRLSSSSPSGTNVLVSPLCVSSALALVLAGATPSSLCESELLGTLGVPSHLALPKLTSTVLSSAKKLTDGKESMLGVELTTGNSAWVHGSIKSEYASLVSDVHLASVSALPSDYGPIDDFVSEQTHGLIKNMLSGPVDPLTRAVLVNVVHFKGLWSNKFDSEKTTEGTFHTPDGKKKTGKFMQDLRSMDVAESVEHLGGASVLRLDYGTSENDMVSAGEGFKEPEEKEFCAVLILPKDSTEKSLDDVVNGLENNPLGELLNPLTSERVKLSLPRFKVEFGVESLKPQLRQLGISDAFDGRGVFGSMSDDPEVYLDDVMHKAVMEVTEEGTTAAAATTAIMMARSIPPPPIEMTFDRPFVMLVMHVPTNTPVFIGRMDDPELI